MNKIDGVVVLYKPDASVIDHIKSYVDHLERLYVVDNSENVDQAIIDELSKIHQCEYISNKANLGIAKALNIGAKKAIDNDATWLLTMDQDSKFEPGDFLRLCMYLINVDDKVFGIVSPLHKTKLTANLTNNTDEVLTIMTSGNLVSLFAYNTIGGYDEDYFIDAVDWDYCLRLNMAYFKVLRLNNILLEHNLGNATRHNAFSRKEVIVLNYNKIRRYYITRNKLMVLTRYGKAYPKWSITIFKTLFRDLRHILLYEDDKIQKLKFAAKGVLDFLLKRKGKVL